MIFSYYLGNDQIPALIVFTVPGDSRRSRSSSKQRDAASSAQVLTYTKPGSICCRQCLSAFLRAFDNSSVARRAGRSDGHGLRDVLRKFPQLITMSITNHHETHASQWSHFLPRQSKQCTKAALYLRAPRGYASPWEGAHLVLSI